GNVGADEPRGDRRSRNLRPGAFGPGNPEHLNVGGAGKGGATVQGNIIGTNAAGTVALANGGDGVSITNAAGNTIGGIAAGNVISGNNSMGVHLSGAGAVSNLLVGNFIGTNAAGTAKVGNFYRGVWLENN